MRYLIFLISFIVTSSWGATTDDIWGYDGSFWRDRSLTEANIPLESHDHDGTPTAVVDHGNLNNVTTSQHHAAGISSVVADLTPQLGGDLDGNGFNISLADGTSIQDGDGDEVIYIMGASTPVNYIGVGGSNTGFGVPITTLGTDTNIDLKLSTKGTGKVQSNADFDVVGDITVSGTVDGIDVVAGVQVAVSATISSNQSISAATITKVNFDTEQWDLGADFASDTFTAPTAGRYRISGKVTFNVAASGNNLRVYIYKGGGSVDLSFGVSAGTAPDSIRFNRVLDLAASDTVDIRAYNSSADTLVSGSADSNLQIEYEGT